MEPEGGSSLSELTQYIKRNYPRNCPDIHNAGHQSCSEQNHPKGSLLPHSAHANLHGSFSSKEFPPLTNNILYLSKIKPIQAAKGQEQTMTGKLRRLLQHWAGRQPTPSPEFTVVAFCGVSAAALSSSFSL